MTSTPNPQRKGKQLLQDWHVCALTETHDSSPEALSQLQLPFQVYPETKDMVPATHMENVQHLVAGQEGALFTAYYAVLNGAKIAVTNCCGVRFEFHLRGLLFEAHRVARPALNLHQDPMPGINAKLLGETGEPVTQPPLHTPTPAPAPLIMTTDTIAILMTSQEPPQTPYFDQEEQIEPESDDNMPQRHSYDVVAFSSNTARGGHPPHRPCYGHLGDRVQTRVSYMVTHLSNSYIAYCSKQIGDSLLIGLVIVSHSMYLTHC